MENIKSISLTIVLLFFFALTSNSQSIKQIDKMNISKLKYLDGNGNTYNLTMDSISYLPISAEVSSSGLYNGGKKVSKKMDLIQFQNAKILFDEIFQNTKIHIKDRIKTSGLLIRYDETSVMEEVIISKSEEQSRLEEYLKSLLKE